MSESNTQPRDGEQPTVAESESGLEYPTSEKRHLGLDMELDRYKLGAVDVILHDWAEGTDVYTTAGTAETVSEAVEHDGPVIKDGHFRRFIDPEDRGWPISQHPMAGRRGHHSPEDTFEQPVVLLRKLEYAPVDGGATVDA